MSLFFYLMPSVTTANTTDGLRRLPGQPVVHLDPTMLQRPSTQPYLLFYLTLSHFGKYVTLLFFVPVV